jgi:hypothetical protein
MSRQRWVDDPGPPGGGRRRAADSTEPSGTVEIPVRLGRVQIILWLVTGSLITLDFLVAIAAGLQLLPQTITRFFDGSDRANFVTGARTTMLLLLVLLLFGCAVAARRRDDPSAPGWRLLGFVAAFAFADETTFLHQWLATVLHERYALTGALRYGWALLYLPAAVIVLVVLRRDLRRMAPAVRNRLLPGVLVYVLGAIVLEPVVAVLTEDHGAGATSVKLVLAVADAGQLAGLVLMVSALLIATSRFTSGFTLALTEPEPLRRTLAGPGEVAARRLDHRAGGG